MRMKETTRMECILWYLWRLSIAIAGREGSLWPNGHSIWLRTGRLGFNPWSGQKSLTPGFALINHFYEMILSVRIDCCAELELNDLLYSSIHIYLLKIKWLWDTTFSQKWTVVKSTLLSLKWFSVRIISS